MNAKLSILDGYVNNMVAGNTLGYSLEIGCKDVIDEFGEGFSVDEEVMKLLYDNCIEQAIEYLLGLGDSVQVEALSNIKHVLVNMFDNILASSEIEGIDNLEFSLFTLDNILRTFVIRRRHILNNLIVQYVDKTYTEISSEKLTSVVNDIMSGEVNPLDDLSFDVTDVMKKCGFKPTDMTPDVFFNNLLVYLSEQEIIDITDTSIMNIISLKEMR